MAADASAGVGPRHFASWTSQYFARSFARSGIELRTASAAPSSMNLSSLPTAMNCQPSGHAAGVVGGENVEAARDALALGRLEDPGQGLLEQLLARHGVPSADASRRPGRWGRRRWRRCPGTA